MSGVYRIRNVATGRQYIGGTTQSFSDRWDQHRSKLESGTHVNQGLQSDWNIYGERGFQLEIVEPVEEIGNVPAAEQRWLDKLFASGTPTYNIAERTTFPKDKDWCKEKKMARRDSFFRGWGMRPGRYERKESNIRTDWLMPILQGLACVLILFLDLLFIGSWFFILPPEVDWALGMTLFVIITAMLNWICVKWFLLYPVPKWIPVMAEVQTRRRWTWLLCIRIEITILIVGWSRVWDWWWLQCLKYPDISIPVPSMEGVTGFFILGLFISFVGIIGIVLHPSKYTLGLTAFGGFISTLSHLFSPVSVQVSHERPIIIYTIWAAWCVAWVIGTASLYYRLFLLEICDPYTPLENNKTLVSGTDFPIVPSPGSAEGQTSGM